MCLAPAVFCAYIGQLTVIYVIIVINFWYGVKDLLYPTGPIYFNHCIGLMYSFSQGQVGSGDPTVHCPLSLFHHRH